MIETLTIEGFRGFEKLELAGFGRVNLLVGRNAVGKTSVLEAVSVLSSGADVFAAAGDVLTHRRERWLDHKGLNTSGWLKWTRLFHTSDPENHLAFELRTTDDAGHPSRLRVAPIHARRATDEDGARWQEADGADPEAEVVFRLEDGQDGEVSFIPAERLHRSSAVWDRERWARTPPRRFESLLVRPRGLSGVLLAEIFDRMQLADADAALVDSLGLIDPAISRLAFVSDPQDPKRPRQPYVRRVGRWEAEPLHSLGDGAVRMLHLSMALHDTAGGVLLVDEIENGIHYAVQLKLWKLIFATAAARSVQVFATTHSWDCIEAFQQAAADHPAEGALFRIDRDDDGHFATRYSEEELAVVTKQSIEVR